MAVPVALLTPSPARAFTLNAIFDSSITSLANAAVVEAAFNTAAAAYTSAFGNPVTVNVRVGWGEVGGQGMPGNAAGSSQAALTGYWNYAQMRILLPASLSLPATQTGPGWFAMTRAEAKALGLVAATSTVLDGAVGFSSSLTYDFNPADGITPGSYDFVGIAEHELAEVLGRTTLLSASTATFFQMPIDLFRYSAPGVQNYSYNGAAYFSIDRGRTNLGWWNNSGGGDRGDWLTGSFGSYPNDVQNAYVFPGATSISAADMLVLGAIGWGAPAYIGRADTEPTAIDAPTEMAEPAARTILAIGLAALALVRGPGRLWNFAAPKAFAVATGGRI